MEQSSRQKRMKVRPCADFGGTARPQQPTQPAARRITRNRRNSRLLKNRRRGDPAQCRPGRPIAAPRFAPQPSACSGAFVRSVKRIDATGSSPPTADLAGTQGDRRPLARTVELIRTVVTTAGPNVMIEHFDRRRHDPSLGCSLGQTGRRFVNPSDADSASRAPRFP